MNTKPERFKESSDNYFSHTWGNYDDIVLDDLDILNFLYPYPRHIKFQNLNFSFRITPKDGHIAQLCIILNSSSQCQGLGQSVFTQQRICTRLADMPVHKKSAGLRDIEYIARANGHVEFPTRVLRKIIKINHVRLLSFCVLAGDVGKTTRLFR